jgi:hypothetical protein
VIRVPFCPFGHGGTTKQAAADGSNKGQGARGPLHLRVPGRAPAVRNGEGGRQEQNRQPSDSASQSRRRAWSSRMADSVTSRPGRHAQRRREFKHPCPANRQ